MSNRSALLIWISLRIKSKRNFRIAFPIPLLMFLCISDFLEDVAFIIPNTYHKENVKHMSPGAVKQVTQICADFFHELAVNTEPSDLIDIDISDGPKRFALKCNLK